MGLRAVFAKRPLAYSLNETSTNNSISSIYKGFGERDYKYILSNIFDSLFNNGDSSKKRVWPVWVSFEVNFLQLPEQKPYEKQALIAFLLESGRFKVEASAYNWEAHIGQKALDYVQVKRLTSTSRV